MILKIIKKVLINYLTINLLTPKKFEKTSENDIRVFKKLLKLMRKFSDN